MGVIYKTTNLINGKIYIGKRILDKEKFLRSGYYGSGTLLKASISKYGLENFNREILEEVDNENLSLREVFWIKELCSNDLEIGYNLTIGGNCKYGRKIGKMSDETKQKLREATTKYIKENGHPFKDKSHTEETKELIRSKLKGISFDVERAKRSGEGHRGLKYNKPPKPVKIKMDKNVKIIQKTLDGDFIQIWNSIKDAAIFYGIDRSSISRCCIGEYKKSNGYIWEYLNIDNKK
jgi:group I intron endonuclease